MESDASLEDSNDYTSQIDSNKDYILTLKDPAIHDALLQRLNTFRRNRELCDVVLFVDEKEILAHKIVLAALSPALFDMFIRNDFESSSHSSVRCDLRSIFTGTSPSPTSAARFKNSNKPSVINSPLTIQPISNPPFAYYEFPNADFECFNAIVNFAYSSHLEISSKKVTEMYKLAGSLQMGQIAKACAHFLAQNLNISNCIGIRRQTSSNDEWLVKKVDSFIAKNFQEIVNNSVELTSLTCIKLRVILNIEKSILIRNGFCIAKRAVQYFQSLPKSDYHIDNIIEQLAEKSHLLYLEDNDTLQDCAEIDGNSSVAASDIIQDYKRSIVNQSRSLSVGNISLNNSTVQHHIIGATPVNLNSNRSSTNKFSSTESINSLSSWKSEADDDNQAKLIATHQTSGDFWIALAVLHKRLVTLSIQMTESEDILKRNERSVAVATESKLPADASRQKQCQDRSIRFSRLISSNERTPLPMMDGARCSIGAVFTNGKIIVCGGYNRGECLKSVEEYDIIRGEWRKLPEMNHERGRFDASMAGGKIYAIAGCTGSEELKSAECFDFRTQKWTLIAPLHKRRSQNGCAYLNGLIYCIGGISENSVLKECERYDPEKDQWEIISSMQISRSQAGCTSWRGLIVACGGCDRWNCLDSVEAYDPKTNSWKYLPKLKTSRRGCGVAVVRDSLYVIGGHDGTQSLQSVEILDHPNGQWRPGPILNIARANTHCVVTAGNIIYVLGGFDGAQFLSSIELLANGKNVGWCNWMLEGKNKSVNDAVIAEEEEEMEIDDGYSRKLDDLSAINIEGILQSTAKTCKSMQAA
ncbi:unnamed protein product [Dracunculus medinensis]|uniref:BTB domain-containing protein n=1 Tax=Dracunculus medinensis TaxID=318479 RepID=A0A0N4UJE1_DRAME|nr:unnamed protein product [Dracunculus medinensis]